MKFIDNSESLRESDILEIEKEFQTKFPEDFKNHYLENNGGYPESDTYTWKDGQTTTVNTFFSIKYAGFNSLEKTYTDLVLLESYIPLGIFAFATDDGGNYFCISTRIKDFNKVYYFNNDKYNQANPEESMYFLENNFTDFLNNLEWGQLGK